MVAIASAPRHWSNARTASSPAIAGCESDIYVRNCSVKSAEFLRRARRYARSRGLRFEYNPRHGKGSHGRIVLGNRVTAIKGVNKMLGKGLVLKMLKDLDIDPGEF